MEEGRPTKYKEEYNSQAYKLCLLGHTDEELATFFEVNPDTIYEWKKVHPEFSESISLGKEKADMEIAMELYNGAKDRVVIEQQGFKLKKVYYEDGKRCEDERVEIIEIEKILPGDFRSQQFWLKNRKSRAWRDKQEIEHSVKKIGKDLADEEYE